MRHSLWASSSRLFPAARIFPCSTVCGLPRDAPSRTVRRLALRVRQDLDQAKQDSIFFATMRKALFPAWLKSHQT